MFELKYSGLIRNYLNLIFLHIKYKLLIVQCKLVCGERGGVRMVVKGYRSEWREKKVGWEGTGYWNGCKRIEELER